MGVEYFAITYSVLLFAGMLICIEAGRRFGRASKDAESVTNGKRIIEGAFFGLLSLLLAFSFSGAISRFDIRRDLIIEEANDIGTAYLRVDLLAPESQGKMRDLFRTYLDSRLAIYRALPDLDAAKQELAHSITLQEQIWAFAVDATNGKNNAHPNAGILLMPALNSMIDISNSRTWAAMTHPPAIISIFMFLISLICAFIAGNDLSVKDSRTWVHLMAFALLTSISIFTIFEIEYPRIGFINIEKYDQALIDVRTSMK